MGRQRAVGIWQKNAIMKDRGHLFSWHNCRHPLGRVERLAMINPAPEKGSDGIAGEASRSRSVPESVLSRGDAERNSSLVGII